MAEAIVEVPTPRLNDIEPAVLDALAHSHLVADGDAYRWRVEALDEHAPHRRLSLDLHDLLTSPHGHLGVCADTACRWAFVDASRRQDRRWCSSAGCGNRHRVREHQRRIAAGQELA